MANVTVSVIMPVYGVEDYVGGAIESIQAQTLTDWELFCVDDGSKDRSGEVCDSYAAKDPRIHVIHKENGGAPSARNVAIDQAEGKYLYFCDADDWAEKTMLSDMVRIAEENGSQLVVAGFYIDTFYSDTEKFTQSQEVPSRVFATQREFREHAHELFDQNLLYTPWNKLFLASYIKDNKLYFPQTFWDDFPFNLSVVRDIEKVAVTSEKYYHFIRKREESETARYRSDMYEKREEEDGWMKDLYAYWNVSSPESKEFLDRRYIERLVGCVENLTNKNCDLSRRAKLKEIRQYITTPRAKEAVKNAQPRSGYMKVMLIPFKLRSTLLTYLESNVISYVKSGNTKLFATLKAHR
ncbi:MAG: glycosyltransferase family 2 protein [Clostridia bacterium]|nr:glycosyltransferase family 2 protein [Oscillospiraceae bacterium]MBQ1595820.1 glycosyltransferase family 2 protein [Clostridia bacterium]